MRIREIKPSIMSNEEIAELGPYAYILFTGLWMIADREGRFEFRPRRIKALVMPLWDEVDSEACGNLVEKLRISGLLNLYQVDGKAYGQVANWKKHQRPHPREAPSEIPAAPAEHQLKPVDATDAKSREKVLPRQHLGADEPRGILAMGHGIGVTDVCPLGDVLKGGTGGHKNAPPTPSAKTENPTPPIARKPPAKSEIQTSPIVRKAPVSSKAPGSETTDREPPPRPRKPLDFRPHKPEDVAIVRSSLNGLAQEIRMQPPDDGIVRRVLDAGRGASGLQIHRVLHALFLKEKFRAMYSWGFVPLVVQQCLGVA
jgi:hypothetical protein